MKKKTNRPPTFAETLKRNQAAMRFFAAGSVKPVLRDPAAFDADKRPPTPRQLDRGDLAQGRLDLMESTNDKPAKTSE